VPPDPKLGHYVRQEVLAFTRAHGIDVQDVSDFVTAIGEALANAIEHAHTDRPIEISAWLSKDRLFAAISDHGVGFRAPDRARILSLPEPSAERGRGLPIMRRCADIFNLYSVPGEGTRVTLGRRVRRVSARRRHEAAS
jgi:anti-sigma regulatory factor (Ser/Thr protein kinase)